MTETRASINSLRDVGAIAIKGGVAPRGVGRSCTPGPEEFVNFQGPLVQSSNLFGISSVQFGSLGTSLESSFSSVGGTGTKCLRSVELSSFRSVHELFRP